MALRKIAPIKADFAGVITVTAQHLIDILDSIGPVVSGGIISHRDLLNADPAAITTSATPGTPVHIVGTGAWTANMESVGLSPAFAAGEIVIAAEGDGSYRLDWHIAFKGTNGVRYGVVPRVTRGVALGSPVNTFENDCRDEATWETGKVVSMGAFGGVINLVAQDFVRLYVVASSASADFIVRQSQFALTRVRS